MSNVALAPCSTSTGARFIRRPYASALRLRLRHSQDRIAVALARAAERCQAMSVLGSRISG
jgi:hypothetical protein